MHYKVYIKSIKSACEKICDTTVVSSSNEFTSSDLIILPGNGSFYKGMQEIRLRGFDKIINHFFSRKKKIIGICLGLQVMMRESEESVGTSGLGIIDGTVEGLSQYITSKPIPHVGWNTIINQHSVKQKKIGHSSKIRLSDNEYYYFVHSYFVKPDNEEHVFTLTRYGDHEFCSSIVLDNIFACQFHPEKSGQRGLKILEYFFSLEI